MVIETLSPEDERRLEQWRDEWFEYGRSCLPADRPRAENALRAMYAEINQPPPRIVWAGGPLAAVLFIALYERDHEKKPENIERWVALADGGDWRKLWDAYQPTNKTQGDLWSLTGQSWHWGQHECSWVAHYKFVATLPLEKPYPEDAKRLLELHSDLVQSCGWIWSYEGLSVICERPLRQEMERLADDANGLPRYRLHAEDGPAILCRDGYGVWVWHGVRVPQNVIEEPEKITAKAVLGETNAEVARVMLERMGIERFIDQAKATVLHSDVDGTGQPRRLLSIDMQNDPDRRVVVCEVLCPSTNHRALLRVPPTIRRCDEAIAWTAGVDVSEYHPLIET